jgi:thymidylate kinase
VRGLLSFGRFVRRSPYIESGLVRNWEQGTVDEFPGYDKLIRDVLTARDRLLEFQKARRFADQGRIILCDRFSLKQLQLMDGPQLPQLTAGHNGWFIRLLTRIERSYYPAIAMPNIMIVLKVHPEVAVQRRPDEDAAFVRARSQSIWELNEEDLDAFFVDAAQDKAQVLAQVKRHIWSLL